MADKLGIDVQSIKAALLAAQQALGASDFDDSFVSSVLEQLSDAIEADTVYRKDLEMVAGAGLSEIIRDTGLSDGPLQDLFDRFVELEKRLDEMTR